MTRTEIGLPRFHRRIAEKAADRAAPPVLIVALGDSVTQGVTAYDRFTPDRVYHERFLRGLRDRFPRTTFSLINAGVDGQTASDGRQRFERDVLRHQPDLVLIAFGLNDAVVRGEDQIEAFGDDLRAMIEAIEKIETETILLTPNTMLRRDNPHVPDVYREYVDTMRRVQTEGVLGRFAEQVRRVGAQAGVPVADVYAAWCALEDAGVDTTDMLANGLNHPTPEAHRIAARQLLAVVDTTNPFPTAAAPESTLAR